MFKRKIKIVILDESCRPVQKGNWTDLSLYLEPEVKSGFIILDLLKGVKLNFGIRMTLPKWYRAEIKPRSSTFRKWGLIMPNSIGEIEWNYSENWFGYAYKLAHAHESDVMRKGDKAFQYQISLMPSAPWYIKIADLFVSGFKYIEVDVLTTTRGGDGSTD